MKNVAWSIDSEGLRTCLLMRKKGHLIYGAELNSEHDRMQDLIPAAICCRYSKLVTFIATDRNVEFGELLPDIDWCYVLLNEHPRHILTMEELFLEYRSMIACRM